MSRTCALRPMLGAQLAELRGATSFYLGRRLLLTAAVAAAQTIGRRPVGAVQGGDTVVVEDGSDADHDAALLASLDARRRAHRLTSLEPGRPSSSQLLHRAASSSLGRRA